MPEGGVDHPDQLGRGNQGAAVRDSVHHEQVRGAGHGEAFAAELAQHHIRVNSVHPTGVNTPMVNDGALGAQISRALEGNTRLGAMMINMMPVEIVQPEDVADTVLFLASDESKYITAHELAPDAGVTEY